jgi:hypothetical protein
MELRLLAKHNPDNHVCIAAARAMRPARRVAVALEPAATGAQGHDAAQPVPLWHHRHGGTHQTARVDGVVG